MEVAEPATTLVVDRAEAGANALDADRPIMRLENVSVAFSGRAAVRDVTFDVLSGQVTALIGPSGCGKTTLLRALNRMHDTVRGARVTGSVHLAGVDIYAKTLHPTVLRSRVGMVFQQANPFPTMSIYQNVVSGLHFNGVKKAFLRERAESALIAAALWDEVKDRLHSNALSLSGGQQQRLCIARSLAIEPEVLLMDEPTSALDPQATRHIEDLIAALKQGITILIVTHNMQQAARISDQCAFLLMAHDHAGELIEFGPTKQIFESPKDERTAAYVNGEFG